MRITKVYTRTGDAGRTRLAGGADISKADLRIEAYGTVDELNALIGIVRTCARQTSSDYPEARRLDSALHAIQNRLFDVGGELASPPESIHPQQSLVRESDIKDLEDSIDGWNEDLDPLTEFTLPGGGMLGAYFHQARTVCRRAERRVVTLRLEEPTALREDSRVVAYLNRLSDWLFVAGRWASKTCCEDEYLWERR